MEYNPLLSISTASLEIGAAAWALLGPGRKTIIRTTASILLFLAGYQIVEAIFCTGLLPFTGSLLPRLAFIVVAWLPPMGLLLVAQLYPTRAHTIHWYSYAMFFFCTVLVSGIIISKDFVSESVCLIVFARYTNPTPLYQFYGIFYQLGLMSMLLLSAYGTTICRDEHQRLLIGQVLLGCLAFILPSLAAVSIIPIAENALPSIMCHFALLLAFFLMRLVSIERKHISIANDQLIPDTANVVG